MASSDLPFPNNVRVDNGSFFGNARFGRRKRMILILLLVAIFFFLWFNIDLGRSNDNSINIYVPDDATGLNPENQRIKNDVDNLSNPIVIEEEEEEAEEAEADEEQTLKEEIEFEQSVEKTLSKSTTIQMQPQHFKYFIIIASRASHSSRRQLIRNTYFGLNDNIEPCMKRDKGINYMFWIYGDEPASKTPESRLYETEKMEWNDLEKVNDTKSFQQDDILKWVESTLVNERGVTYDYLIIQDSYSLIQFNYIQQQIQSEVGKMWEKEKTATDLVWVSPKNLQFLVAGSDAVKKLMARQTEFENITPENLDSTLMINYHEFYRSIQIQLNFVTDPKEIEQLKSLTSEAPVFISAEGRFQTWDNHVESIPDMTITVSNIYQDADFISIAKVLNIGTTLICKPLEKAIIAVITSSFIYPDSCMEPSAALAANNKRQYALSHNYAFVARSNEFAQQALRSPKRRTVWGKIDAVQKVLPRYDWLFWMDMDAVIMNPNQTIHGILDDLRVKYPKGPRGFEEEIDLVIAKPTRDKMINAGVFLLRNTAWAQKFLNAVQESKEWYNKGPSYEQGAMWDLIQLPGYKEHVLLLDNDDHTFNTLPSRYVSGDFIVHYAPDKCPSPAVLNGLEIAERIQQGEDITSLKDDM
ncbi:galactosyl transferase GMA12/MNN10 family-domain-containing protein [Cokeromyces recurvatus]|uniref:galactosyl transferase GMA12/MNN10 family-domain-containing protein n=1 Tax=Cokeromyces recurvatus TaxID=90255 RepID=UPI00221FEDF2|nr:galactosyl transferase GMA12/MNN10 family-domain-containing protein [Cokeromyces recurvatus]KAI7907057.1 galactosyl transferase GMA12/MNN10 family-domain-containing protein [Cokeromyces recurvatus]